MKPEEFNHIIIPMRASLEQFARKMTGDDSRAEDLVQEVMLKMWSIRDTLERYDSKEALAVAILKNKARTYGGTTKWNRERLPRAAKRPLKTLKRSMPTRLTDKAHRGTPASVAAKAVQDEGN